MELNQLELWTLYLHLQEWLSENEDFQNSALPEIFGKWKCLKNIYEKIKSKI